MTPVAEMNAQIEALLRAQNATLAAELEATLKVNAVQQQQLTAQQRINQALRTEVELKQQADHTPIDVDAIVAHALQASYDEEYNKAITAKGIAKQADIEAVYASRNEQHLRNRALTNALLREETDLKAALACQSQTDRIQALSLYFCGACEQSNTQAARNLQSQEDHLHAFGLDNRNMDALSGRMQALAVQDEEDAIAAVALHIQLNP